MSTFISNKSANTAIEEQSSGYIFPEGCEPWFNEVHVLDFLGVL